MAFYDPFADLDHAMNGTEQISDPLLLGDNEPPLYMPVNINHPSFDFSRPANERDGVDGDEQHQQQQPESTYLTINHRFCIGLMSTVMPFNPDVLGKTSRSMSVFRRATP